MKIGLFTFLLSFYWEHGKLLQRISSYGFYENYL